MAFDAPAPCALLRRRAEHREEVALRIAHQRRVTRRLRRGRALRCFECTEHGLELHDRRRGEVAALAQTSLEQLVGELALRLRHFLDRQTLAWKRLGRDEVPVQALLRLERERGLLPLLRGQPAEKLVGRRSHRRGRALGGDGRRDRAGGEKRCRQEQTGRVQAFHEQDSSLTTVWRGRDDRARGKLVHEQTWVWVA